MNDINKMKDKATECARECVDRLKNVDWKARGEQAKAKAKELASKENIDKVKAGIKSGVADLKTAEGRDRLKASVITGATTDKDKIVATWNSGMKGKAICVGVSIASLLFFTRCLSSGTSRNHNGVDDHFHEAQVDMLCEAGFNEQENEGENVAEDSSSKLWQCAKRFEIEESDYKPSGGQCDADNSPCRWELLGETGDSVWQCRKCGVQVGTRSRPEGRKCSAETNGTHAWNKVN